MAIIKLNKKKLYEYMLKMMLAEEKYENAANFRDVIKNIPEDELIEYDDGRGKKSKKKE